MTQTAFDPSAAGWASYDFNDPTTGIVQRDLSPVIADVLRRDPTFLGTIGMGQAAKHYKVEWFERDWIPFQFTTNTDIPNTTADVDVTLLEDNMGKWLGIGTKVMLTGYATSGAFTFTPGEIFHVTKTDLTLLGSASKAIITLTRQFGGTPLSNTATSASITAQGLQFEILGASLPENSTPSTDHSRGYGPAIVNYTEIDGFDIAMSRTAKVLNLHGMSDFWSTQIKELTEELRLRLNRKAIYGVPQGMDTSPHGNSYGGSDTQLRSMGGIKYYINRSGGNVISSGYTTPTEDLINHLCRLIIAKNGQLNNRKGNILVHPANAEILGDLWKDKIYINREDTTRGVQVKTIVTKLGFQLDIVWDQNMRPNDMIIYNPSKIELAPLQGSAWFVKKYDNGSDGDTARILGEWTLRIRDSLKDHAICTCLTTPAW